MTLFNINIHKINQSINKSSRARFEVLLTSLDISDVDTVWTWGINS